MTEDQKRIAKKIVTRILWEGTKAVLKAGALVALTALFKGEIKDVSFEKLLDGEDE